MQQWYLGKRRGKTVTSELIVGRVRESAQSDWGRRVVSLGWELQEKR